ncbi:hypothetical protein AB0E69_06310 [Kribbella sp. NPDC026611]|uniref:hypothetical protein n=1 Tax=Kribbella sp. NPDC026611 TaxID=3154911 RepID=UPI003405BE75
MTNDIEDLLAAAADDSGRPLRTEVDDILVRARRSVRRSRIATVSTAVLTTAAIVGGIAAWSAHRTEGVGPADKPAITIKANGEVVDHATGDTIGAPPPVSPLSDAEVLQRCKQYDQENVDFLHQHNANVWDQAGPINGTWTVVVKSGDENLLEAMFLAPDKSIVSTCTMDAADRPVRNGRQSTTHVMDFSATKQPDAVEAGVWIPVPGAKRVLVDTAQGPVRQALVGSDGFYALGYTGNRNGSGPIKRIRAFDANGRQLWTFVSKPPNLPQYKETPVPANVSVKTVAPIEPKVLLTKDPETGKKLAPPPPVSPLTDDQVRTRCATVDAIDLKRVGGAELPVGMDWTVPLKTGTGNKLTALLVSPDGRTAAWCHMLGTSAKGPYDYGRSKVQANGKFHDAFEWGMVPEKVAQIIVDLPKEGPTRALMSNGYYIWGLTGGNSDLQTVRVRGYDANGKKVYDEKKQLDADFD